MKIYMKKVQIQNKIYKKPLKMSNSLDKIYLGGLKLYIIIIYGWLCVFFFKNLRNKKFW